MDLVELKSWEPYLAGITGPIFNQLLDLGMNFAQ